MVKISLPKLATVPACLRDSVNRTKVAYRKLGNCGLRVSSPILGGIHLGSSKWFPWVLNEDKVGRQISQMIAIFTSQATNLNIHC